MKPSATLAARTRELATEAWLSEHGWWASDDGWRHRGLAWAWPRELAARLTVEMHDGHEESAHVALRDGR